MKLFVVLLLFSSLTLGAEKHFGDVLVSEVTSIYDADTFRVNIRGWPDLIGKNISIRVLGVDAPEIRGKCIAEKKAARRAKQFTVEMLRTAKTIELKNIKRGKYFRILAEVYIDGKNLAESLISAQQGRPYDGGKRLGWCNQKAG